MYKLRIYNNALSIPRQTHSQFCSLLLNYSDAVER
jgi:hypothetical protein